MTLAQWNKVLGINLTGMFLCSQLAVKEFVRRGPRAELSKALGKIICMSSVHEVIPWAGHVNYARLQGRREALHAVAFAGGGTLKIRVNSIGPGAIATPINRGRLETKEALDKLPS